MEYEQSYGTHRAYTQYIAPGFLRTEWADKTRHCLAILTDCLSYLCVEGLSAPAGRIGPRVELSDLIRVGADVLLPRVGEEPAYLYRARIARAWDYWANAGSDYGATILYLTLGKGDLLRLYPNPNLTGPISVNQDEMFGSPFAIETYCQADWPDLVWPTTDSIRVVVIAPWQGSPGSAAAIVNSGYTSLTPSSAPGICWLVGFNIPSHARTVETASGATLGSLAYACDRYRFIGQRGNKGKTIADMIGVTIGNQYGGGVESARPFL